MLFDIDALDPARSYKLLTATVVPRPIAWVVSADAEGRLNAAPFSFFNCFGGHPPLLCIGIGRRDGKPKDTLANIETRGEFVVNLVPQELVEAMNTTAVDFPADHDEIALAGLATLPSAKVGVPRIADSPVALECRFQQRFDVDASAHIVIARVVAVHVRDDAVIDAARCHLDSSRLRLVGRMQSPSGYVRTSDAFRLERLDVARWTALQAAAGSEPAAGRDAGRRS